MKNPALLFISDFFEKENNLNLSYFPNTQIFQGKYVFFSLRTISNHQLNKAEIGMTDESISDWISGSQITFSSSKISLFQFWILFKMYKSANYSCVKKYVTCVWPQIVTFWGGIGLPSVAPSTRASVHLGNSDWNFTPSQSPWVQFSYQNKLYWVFSLLTGVPMTPSVAQLGQYCIAVMFSTLNLHTNS